MIDASTHRVLQHLQITQSFNGYQNYLGMLHLDEHGRAPVTGPELKKERSALDPLADPNRSIPGGPDAGPFNIGGDPMAEDFLRKGMEAAVQEEP